MHMSAIYKRVTDEDNRFGCRVKYKEQRTTYLWTLRYNYVIYPIIALPYITLYCLYNKNTYHMPRYTCYLCFYVRSIEHENNITCQGM